VCVCVWIESIVYQQRPVIINRETHQNANLMLVCSWFEEN